MITRRRILLCDFIFTIIQKIVDKYILCQAKGKQKLIANHNSTLNWNRLYSEIIAKTEDAIRSV